VVLEHFLDPFRAKMGPGQRIFEGQKNMFFEKKCPKAAQKRT